MSRSLRRSTIETFQLSFCGFLAASPSSLATTSTTEIAIVRGAAGACGAGCAAATAGVAGTCGEAGGVLRPSFSRMLPNKLMRDLLIDVVLPYPTIAQPTAWR